jgi:hypothetical protein
VSKRNTNLAKGYGQKNIWRSEVARNRPRNRTQWVKIKTVVSVAFIPISREITRKCKICRITSIENNAKKQEKKVRRLGNWRHSPEQAVKAITFVLVEWSPYNDQYAIALSTELGSNRKMNPGELFTRHYLCLSLRFLFENHLSYQVGENCLNFLFGKPLDLLFLTRVTVEASPSQRRKWVHVNVIEETEKANETGAVLLCSSEFVTKYLQQFLD